MHSRVILLAAAVVALGACTQDVDGSDGDSREVDESFAAFCKTDPMFGGSEPCINPQKFSDAQKEQIMTGTRQMQKGMDKIEAQIEADLEEARKKAGAAGN